MKHLKPETKELFERVLGLHLPSFLDYNIIHQSILPALIDIHCNEITPNGFDQESSVSKQLYGSNDYNWIIWHIGDIYVSGSLDDIVAELAVLVLNVENERKKITS